MARRGISRRSAVLGAVGLPAALGRAAAEDQVPITRVAFGSCMNQEKPQPLWSAILAFRPELFLFLGDNVYGDIRNGQRVPESESLTSLAEAYAKAVAIPGLMALRSTVRHAAIWDDHDYGKNDGGAEYPFRAEAQKLFAEFWRLPADDERRLREGLYHAFTLGPANQRLQVIILDTRYFRSPLKPANPRRPGRERYEPDADPSKTMLGEAQWAWLAEKLREPAQLRIIVSPIQVLAEGHGFERWGNLPLELRRLGKTISEAGAEGVVFISGDRHLGALYRDDPGIGYPVTEITSSGITEFFPTSLEPPFNRLGPVYGAVNFGTLEIDWAAGHVQASLRDLAGNAVRVTTFRLDALRIR